MKSEIRSLTGLRGVAALYVAIYHMFNRWIRSRPASPFHLSTFLKHGYMSVDMFFILSGFVITLSSKKLFETGMKKSNYILFMKKRFSRVYPIYIIITIIAFGLLSRFQGIGALIQNIFLVQVFTSANYILGPSWSLSAEWFAYLLFPLFFYLVYLYQGKLWNLLCLIAGFLVLIFISTNFNPFLNGIQSITATFGPLDKFRFVAAVLRCFSEYLIGITLFKIYATYKEKYARYYGMAALACTVVLTILLFVPDSDVAIVLLFAGLIFSLSTDQGIIAKVLGSKYIYLLGQISYSLYLIHPIIIDIRARMYNTLYKFGISNSNTISYVIGFLCLIAFSYLTYKYIEIPSRNYLKSKLHC
jgi:peptidoglycan/LPS O-acetylase OafA/YrhL